MPEERDNQPVRVARADDIVPQPCQVLGTPLRPFCLGHHLLFRKLSLPFAGNWEADAGPEDVLLGIAICAASYEETLESLRVGDWPDVFSRWKRKIAGPWWHRRRNNLWHAEMLFRSYLKSGYEMPPLMRQKEFIGIEMSAPWELLLKVRLAMAGFSEPEIFNGYLPARWYEYFTAVEIQNAANCSDIKNWKRIFYSAEFHAQLHPEKP